MAQDGDLPWQPSLKCHFQPTVNTPQTTWQGVTLADGLTTHGVGSDGTLTATSESLSIRSKVGSFVFHPEDIACIRAAGFLPWFGAGILVIHRNQGYPREIGFWPRGVSSRELLKALASHGYTVA